MTEEQMLTIREVADHLKVSEKTIRRRVKDGEIPAYRPSEKYLIKLSDLESYLEANRINTNGDSQ